MRVLRIDAFYQLKEIFENIKPIYRSCLNCEHFNESKEICKLNEMRPPAKVIAYSCELWEDIEIPF